jgi:hypothetical protein
VVNVTFALTLSAWSAYEADAPDAPEQTTEVHMFSTNIKQKGRKGRRLTSRRRAGGILVGGTFGLFALLWSGLIVYVGLAARAEIAPMDVLTCQVAVASKPKAAIASGDQDPADQASCDRKLARMGRPS